MPFSFVQFAKTFTLEYYFEEVQRLKVEVYDVDSVRFISDLKRHDFIGEVELTLAEIVSAGQQLTRSLRSKGKCLMHWVIRILHTHVQLQ